MDFNNNLRGPAKALPNRSLEIAKGRENGLFTLKTSLILPKPLEIVFPFFADAGNLGKITPPWLRFEILTRLPIEMGIGTFIEYRLRIHGIVMRWQTEITAWDPPFRFVDEQRHGPYRKWIHEHTFSRCGDDSEIRDFVKYDPPGGRLVNFLFVRRDVRRIFTYRTQKLVDLFA